MCYAYQQLVAAALRLVTFAVRSCATSLLSEVWLGDPTPFICECVRSSFGGEQPDALRVRLWKTIRLTDERDRCGVGIANASTHARSWLLCLSPGRMRDDHACLRGVSGGTRRELLVLGIAPGS
jgi:hypothetical protein